MNRLSDEVLLAILALQPGGGTPPTGPGFTGFWIAILWRHLATARSTRGLTARAGGAASEKIHGGQAKFADQRLLTGNAVTPGVSPGLFNLAVEGLALREKILKRTHGVFH